MLLAQFTYWNLACAPLNPSATPLKAATAALSTFGIAGELASRRHTGPGTYKEYLYDEIFNLDEDVIEDMQKIESPKKKEKDEAKIESD